MHQKDTSEPPVSVKGERMYTLYVRDIAQMPSVDFQSLVLVDVNVRSLLN